MVSSGRSKAECSLLNLNTMKYNEFASILSNQNFLNPMNLNESSSVDINFVHRPTSLPDSIHSNDEGDLHDDFDFSDLALKYINQMLMEEAIEEKNCMLHESPALQATEKSFYDALTTKDLPCNSSHSTAPYGRDLTSDVSDSTSPSIHFDSNSRFHSPVSILGFPDTFSNNPQSVVVKAEIKHEISSTSISRSRGKKNPYPHSNSENLSDEGRNSKQSAVYAEPTVRSKMFDEILLCDESKSGCLKSQLKELNPVKPRGKKKGSGKKEVVDLRTLLTLCAQSVSTNDKIGVVNFLNQIRQHSSPIGDGMQRLAHYFSLGLEARMAGSGTGIYNSLVSKPTSAVDVLKAYHLILEILPFIKLTHFISNKTIINASKHKSKLHIIDFGIFYGFQWPSLIQRLSSRPGGPPELRITGIDFPCPGFRPSQRVEETGSRLANYAETFKVPFRFKAIAQKWETITIQDLELGDDESETVVVNCPYRFRNLLDETVISDLDSPRSKVLKLIKQINPEIFIHGIVNGTYNAPFFVTRFREALFFFSSLFDLLEANVGRDVEERRLIERTIWGREAMNVIACESGERIERPESYKQWQVRHQRLGFRQLAFDREVLEVAMERGRLGYHKDFVIGEDGGWVLQGWKGRDLYALSCWKPC